MTQREDRERAKTARECLGKYFYDLSKTSFLVMVAGNAITMYSDGELKTINLCNMIVGIILTYVFAYLGNFILTKKK